MIIVRDIFQLRFGSAKEAVALLKEGQQSLERSGYPTGHILTDVTGEYYTVVMESSFTSLADFESGLATAAKTAEWQAVFARLKPLVRSGRREVFRVVE
jgi:hypothetical protein